VAEEPIEGEGFWQRRADEARSLAESLTHPTAKREILLVAAHFEILAKCMPGRSGTLVRAKRCPTEQENGFSCRDV